MFQSGAGGGGMGGHGLVSHAQGYFKQKVKVRFSDVADAEEKQELVEVVEFLKDLNVSLSWGTYPSWCLTGGPSRD